MADPIARRDDARGDGVEARRELARRTSRSSSTSFLERIDAAASRSPRPSADAVARPAPRPPGNRDHARRDGDRDPAVRRSRAGVGRARRRITVVCVGADLIVRTASASSYATRRSGAAGDDEQRAARAAARTRVVRAEAASAESADAPERLGRDERRDDRHPAAVVRLEEADVREPEAGCRPERRRAARARLGSAPRVGERDERAGEERRGGGDLRARVARASARTRLSRTAKSTAAPRAKSEPDGGVLGPVALADERDAAGDDRERAETSGADRLVEERRARSRPRRAAPRRPRPTSATRPPRGSRA